MFWLVSVLCNRQWSILKLSPLFGLNYDPDFLSRWAQSIEKDFEATVNLSEVALNQKISVKIQKVTGLRGTTDDPEALQIQLFTERSRQILFTSFLVSVDCVDKLELGSHSEELTNLPVMLCCGLKELERIVRDSLGKCFHCVVGDVQIKEEDLKWITAMWSGLRKEEEENKTMDNDEQTKQNQNMPDVALTYQFSKKLKDTIKTVDVNLKHQHLAQLWGR